MELRTLAVAVVVVFDRVSLSPTEHLRAIPGAFGIPHCPFCHEPGLGLKPMLFPIVTINNNILASSHSISQDHHQTRPS